MKNGLPSAGIGVRDELRNPSGVVVILISIAALYFARELLIPFAFALTLTFLLTPVAASLQRLRIGRILAVLATVLFAIVLAGGAVWVILNQLADVATELPQYRDNIHAKVETLRVPTDGQFGRAAKSVQELIGELTLPDTSTTSAPSVPNRKQKPPAAPLSVRVIPQPTNELTEIRDLASPILAPLARTGMVLIFTIFMLLQREDLRNRLLRLAGVGQLNRMTQVLDDASRRISRYLVMQFLVNATFGTLFGFGLYLIGVPYPALWGIVAGILRLVPYIGTPVAAFLPFALSLAVFDGWHRPLLVIVLVAALELTIANFVEPWLYGSHVGISSLALLVSSVFWAVLWGPSGLILATPLTVCVVVLGRYVPQLSFLHILLGDEPVLAAEAQMYQRLLAMDQQEAHSIVTDFLKTKSLVELYDTVLIPALVMAEQDRHKGTMNSAREEFLFVSVNEMIAELAEYEPPGEPAEHAAPVVERGSGRVLCLPANDQADEIAGAMLGQLLEKNGISTLAFPLGEHSPEELLTLVKAGPHDVICISAVPPYAFAPARALCRQIRERFPKLKLVVCVWTFSGDTNKALARFERAQPDHLCVSLVEVLARVQDLAGSPVAS